MWRILTVMVLLVASPGIASATGSSRFCSQVTYVSGGFERLCVGCRFSVALSSSPGTVVASDANGTDAQGWGCVCLSQSGNYNVTRGTQVSSDEFIAVGDLIGAGTCTP